MIKIVDQHDRHNGHHKHGVQLRWSWIINVPGGYVEVPWGYGDALGGYTESSVLELLGQRKAKQRQKDNFADLTNLAHLLSIASNIFINIVAALLFILQDDLCTDHRLSVMIICVLHASCQYRASRPSKLSATNRTPPSLKIASLAKIIMLWRLVLKIFLIFIKIIKFNRCLARYSPRATTTNRTTNRAPNEPARAKKIFDHTKGAHLSTSSWEPRR